MSDVLKSGGLSELRKLAREHNLEQTMRDLENEIERLEEEVDNHTVSLDAERVWLQETHEATSKALVKKHVEELDSLQLQLQQALQAQGAAPAAGSELQEKIELAAACAISV